MKVKILYVFVASLLFLLTSCFEILEEITLNENGSGVFEFTTNLSQSKTKLKSIMLMDKVNGYKVPSKQKITTEINKICVLAKNTNGISGVKKTIDFENYIFSFKCNFTNIESLNKVVENIRIAKNGKTNKYDTQYKYDKTNKVFSRYFNNSLKQEYSKMKQADKEIFKEANYIAIYKFKKEVVSTSNKMTKTSPSKKATMLRLKATDLINGKATVKNTIRLK